MTTQEMIDECARLKRETDALWAQLLNKFGTWVKLGEDSDAQQAKNHLLNAGDSLRFARHALYAVRESERPATLGHHPAPSAENEVTA